MNDIMLRTAGLSGDYGWNDAEDQSSSAIDTAVLVGSAAFVWVSLWLTAGLPPLGLWLTRNWRVQR